MHRTTLVFPECPPQQLQWPRNHLIKVLIARIRSKTFSQYDGAVVSCGFSKGSKSETRRSRSGEKVQESVHLICGKIFRGRGDGASAIAMERSSKSASRIGHSMPHATPNKLFYIEVCFRFMCLSISRQHRSPQQLL